MGNTAIFSKACFDRGRRGGSEPGRPEFHLHGEDRHARVSVDLRDSYNGAQRPITLGVPELTEDGRILLKEKALNVKIPKGVREGQKIRLAGQGGPGIGKGKGRRPVSRGRIRAGRCVPGRRDRRLYEPAGNPVGSSAWRQRHGADPRRASWYLKDTPPAPTKAASCG